MNTINFDNVLKTTIPVTVGTNSATGAIIKVAYARPVSYYYNMETDQFQVGIKYWYEVEQIIDGVPTMVPKYFFSELKKMSPLDIHFMWNNVVTPATSSLSHEQMLPKAVVECLLFVLNNGMLFSAPLGSWVKYNTVV